MLRLRMHGVLPDSPYRNDWQNDKDNAPIVTETNIIKYYKICGGGLKNRYQNFKWTWRKTLKILMK
jgi:hypothetical protein